MNSNIFITYPLYCPHCGRFNIGLRDNNDTIRYSCSACGTGFQKSLASLQYTAGLKAAVQNAALSSFVRKAL